MPLRFPEEIARALGNVSEIAQIHQDQADPGALGIEIVSGVDALLRAPFAVRRLVEEIQQHPCMIVSDNGTELTSNAIDLPLRTSSRMD